MDKQTTAQPYPWYDDRVEAVRKEYVNPWAEAEGPAVEPTWYTPREIYNYLDGKVWKQDEAKRAVSVIMYQCLRGAISRVMLLAATKALRSACPVIRL